MKNSHFIILLILITIIIKILVNNYSIRYAVGYSMYPTINNLDIYIAKELSDKEKLNLKKDDIIIFNKMNKNMIKRIKGVPGDKVELKYDNIYINNERIKNGLILERNNDRTIYIDDGYFVIGDNTIDSIDSRLIGIIEYDDITHIYINNLSKIFRKLFKSKVELKLCK